MQDTNLQANTFAFKNAYRTTQYLTHIELHSIWASVENCLQYAIWQLQIRFFGDTTFAVIYFFDQRDYKLLGATKGGGGLSVAGGIQTETAMYQGGFKQDSCTNQGVRLNGQNGPF